MIYERSKIYEMTSEYRQAINDVIQLINNVKDVI